MPAPPTGPALPLYFGSRGKLCSQSPQHWMAQRWVLGRMENLNVMVPYPIAGLVNRKGQRDEYRSSKEQRDEEWGRNPCFLHLQDVLS